MTQQERREYIAEKILKGEKFYLEEEFIGWKLKGRDLLVFAKTDFESLPEWVGPICDVVFPMLSEKGWSISFLGNGYASLCGPLGWAILDIRTGPISTVLVDAHIKIENDKMESFKDDLKIISDFSNEELNSLELAFHEIPHEKEMHLSFFATFVEGAMAYRDMQTQNPKGKQNG
ncbi:hypothetical protein LEP1GSC073_2735 [Leptospira noguchii str. Cascata]|nr:hypothetical protein LEP1GSC073_2735 [Leptospira noguchii str. Cascata]